MANHAAARHGGSTDPQELSHALIDAIQRNSYNRAYALLRRIKREHIALREEDAKEALIYALCSTLRLFRAVHETLFPNGTDATMSFCTDVEFHLSKEAHIEGSLLLLAAAFDKPEHARYLIDMGYDANGCPPYARPYELPPQAVSITDPLSSLFSLTAMEPFLLSDCSPLAAAILFGSAIVIDVFTGRSDVQREENASVCRAAAFVLSDPLGRHSGPMQEMCVNTVFTAWPFYDRGGHGAGLPRFPLDAIADICTPELFEQQLRSWQRNEEEARAALEVLAAGDFWTTEQNAAAMAQKLRLLASLFPALCREAWSSDFFLTVLCRVGMQDKAFADCCLSLLGDTVNLTEAFSVRPPDKELSALLRRLHGKRLVINADGFDLGVSRTTVMQLLASAEIEPSCFPSGLSALASWLLHRADVKLLRHPKVRSLLRYEPREALIDAIRQVQNNSVRAVLLSVDSTPEPDAVRAARYARYGGCTTFEKTLESKLPGQKVYSLFRCTPIAKILEENHRQDWRSSTFDLL